jgi:methionyl-tRNA formyltransferase
MKYAPDLQVSAAPMRVVLVTQDDPFYLGESLARLLEILPEGTTIEGCVLLAPSPFGGRESFMAKAQRTYATFGPRFFAVYALRYLMSRLRPHRSVAAVLRRRGIPVVRLRTSINHPDALSRIAAFTPDVLVSILCNEVFKRPLIELAPKGCLNLHSALLPKYRGLMPSFWVLKNGERTTGVSVFFVDDGIDSGPILVQREIPIDAMSQSQLIRTTKAIGMEAVAEALAKIRDGDTGTLPNDDAQATYFSFPARSDVAEFRRAGGRFF